MVTFFKPTSNNTSLIEFVLLMAMLTALPAISIDIVLPALAILPQEFASVRQEDAPLVISIFFVGLGLGQLVFGPLSDSWGRRSAIFLGMGIFIVGTLVCLFASAFSTFLLGRFLQALGASSPRIVTMAIVRDQFEGNEMARVLSFIITVFITVPMFAPLMGQTIMHYTNWHGIFVLMLVFAVLSTIWFHARQTETLAEANRKTLSPGFLCRELVRILCIKSVFGYTLAMGAGFGVMVTAISFAQHMLQNIYDTGDKFPYFFAALALSLGVSSYINGRLVRRFGMFNLVLLAMLGTMLCSSVMFILCVLNDGVPPFYSYLLISFTINFCNGVLMGNLGALCLQPLGDAAGFGAAVTSSISTFISVPIAMLVGLFLKDTVTPYALGFLISSCFAVLFAYWAHANSLESTKS